MKFTAKNQIRVDVIARYIDGRIRREHAEEALEVSERQFRRIVQRFREKGMISLCHGNVGRAPINKTSQDIVDKIKKFATSDYKGFNMTHFREKLLENTHFNVVPSYGVIRRIFTEEKIYSPQKKRRGRAHKSRNRYEKEGLMVQMDGSPHKWFGHQMSCLISAIDDATGKILGMIFSKTETTFASMDVLEYILNTHGRFNIL
jgi:transposase